MLILVVYVYSRFSHISPVTWLDFYSGVTLLIRTFEWYRMTQHSRNRVTWPGRYERTYCISILSLTSLKMSKTRKKLTNLVHCWSVVSKYHFSKAALQGPHSGGETQSLSIPVSLALVTVSESRKIVWKIKLEKKLKLKIKGKKVWKKSCEK